MFDVFVMYWWQFILLMVASCAIGGINFAVIFSRLFKKTNIRECGSGNPGTTNVYRVFGIKLGALTLLFDALKGAVCCLSAILLFKRFGDDVATTAGYLAELCAVLGHVFPVYYKLRGGKGVATCLGASMVMQPILTLCCILPMCLIIWLTDRMSVMSILWSVFMVLWCWLAQLRQIGVFCCLLITLTFVTVIFAHRHNIVRLCLGQELPMGVRRAIRGKKNDGDGDNKV